MHRWAVALLVLASCTGMPGDPDGEQSERFAGRWIVDQPFHAGYEATVYDLSPLGNVTALDACTLSPLDDAAYVTGTVEALSGTRCAFGDHWQSDGADQLLIAGDCDDGEERLIALGFSADSSRNTEGTDVVVDAVDGERDWDHRDFAWQWTKCPASGCEPVWVCR